MVSFILFFVTPMLLTVYLYHSVFGVRVDTPNEYYSYLTKARPDFLRTAASFNSNKGQKLQGYFYFYDSTPYKGLVVMAHGMGGGHDSYLAEAEYLASRGYLIFAYDNTGTNESEGKRLIGLSQSGIDLHYALQFVESLPMLDKLPLLLYGHSWGGFAVTAVNNYPHRVKAVVSVAGFEENSNVLKQQGRAMVGDIISLFMPYVHLYERMLFGDAATHTGISGLSKTDAKVLIIHSKDDPIVDYEANFMRYKSTFSDNPRFTFLSLTSHGHNAVLSQEADAAIKKIHEQMENLHAPQSKAYMALQSQEESWILELDTQVMDSIVHFFDTVCLAPHALP